MNTFVIEYKSSANGRWYNADATAFRFYDEANRVMAKFQKANPNTEYRIL
jgi:hypothetical protein